MGRDGDLCTHTAYTLPLRTIYEHQLYAGFPLLPRERGRSPTPPRPLELGSGAKVNTTIAYTSTPKYRRPRASAPVGGTTPPMMGSVLLSRGDCLPKKCLRIRKVSLLPCWFLLQPRRITHTKETRPWNSRHSRLKYHSSVHGTVSLTWTFQSTYKTHVKAQMDIDNDLLEMLSNAEASAGGTRPGRSVGVPPAR